MSNLLDHLKDYVTPEIVSAAATTLNETESGVGKAVGGLLPALLAGMLNKSGDASALSDVFHQLANPAHADFLSQLNGLVGSGNLAQNDPKDAAGALMGDLFGAKVPAILNALSAFAGVKSSSTSSLLGLVGPLVMGYFSQKINQEGLNPSGLANLLQSEKSSILGALPSGLGTIMGLAGFHKATPAVSSETEAAGGTRWLLPLLLLLALGGGIMFYLKNCTNYYAEKDGETAPEVAPAPAPAPAAEVPAATGLTFAPGTQEAALLAFVKNPSAAIDKSVWFDFPEIQFDVNKATLKPESEAKLNAVLAVLKEFPAVKLKVGGYTDSDGNDAKNLSLSDARAKAAAAWLIAKGIAADRLDPEGYGEANPVAPNDTPDNKAKNRRISFSVRAK